MRIRIKKEIKKIKKEKILLIVVLKKVIIKKYLRRLRKYV